MALTGYKRLCSKKSGGIRQIGLIEADKITAATYNADSDAYTAITLAAGAKFAKYEFREDEAQLVEKVLNTKGALIVEHELTLVLGKMDAASRKAVDEIAATSCGGIVALVTDNNGYTVLAGYSQEFGKERALRLSTAEGQSGRKLSDLTYESVTLTTTDTAKARAFTGDTATLTA